VLAATACCSAGMPGKTSWISPPLAALYWHLRELLGKAGDENTTFPF